MATGSTVCGAHASRRTFHGHFQTLFVVHLKTGTWHNPLNTNLSLLRDIMLHLLLTAQYKIDTLEMKELGSVGTTKSLSFAWIRIQRKILSIKTQIFTLTSLYTLYYIGPACCHVFELSERIGVREGRAPFHWLLTDYRLYFFPSPGRRISNSVPGSLHLHAFSHGAGSFYILHTPQFSPSLSDIIASSEETLRWAAIYQFLPSFTPSPCLSEGTALDKSFALFHRHLRTTNTHRVGSNKCQHQFSTLNNS